MSRVGLALRLLVVSFEFLVVCIGGMLLSFATDVKEWLPGQPISADVLKYLALLPIASTAWVLVQGRGLLFPEKDSQHVLQDWPDYWKLKYGFNVALFYSMCFSGLAVGAWAAPWDAYAPYPQIAMVVALSGAGVNFLSCYYARIDQDEALTRLKRHH